MTRRNTMTGMALPLGATVVFAALLIFSLTHMFKVQDAMRIDAEQNMLWVFHQSDVAALRLTETIALAELNEADRDDVALRFDILASRVALLNQGPQRRLIEQAGFADDLDRLSGDMAVMRPMIDSFTPADGARLRSIMRPFRRMFGRAANAAMIAEWDDLGAQLQSYRNQLHQTIISLVGIMLAGGALVVSLALALRQSRQRTRMLSHERDFSGLLISSSGEGIVAVDDTGRCTLWNEAAATLLHQPAEKAIGRPLDMVAGVFSVAAVQRHLTRALEGRSSDAILQPVFALDSDTPRYVDFRFFPLRKDDGIMGAILFLHDATDRHAAQQREAEDRDRLERMVEARTRALDRALTRERSAADLYRNFAAMVSHQFRTPLAVADSALQRLIRRGAAAPPEELAERAARARAAIAGLTRLVESTLEAARLDAGQISSSNVACDIQAVIETACAAQRDLDPQRKIDVRPRQAAHTKAFCDPAHLEHILKNLLSNAAKYAPEGTPVRVSLDGDDETLFCDVASAGPPIPKAERDSVFARNFRGSNSTGITGTGIGLFMARTLARLQHGELCLLPGDDGVRFRLSLPRLSEDAS